MRSRPVLFADGLLSALRGEDNVESNAAALRVAQLAMLFERLLKGK